ncbi:MAG: SDR family oxidoreductase [Candidatus Edwardsbacteria bacterium]|nr:SDR family oxidoreductase [Candidatus Edwardsbacteria bacterium]
MTGGAGLLGQTIVRCLRDRHQVLYTQHHHRLRIRGAEPVSADLCSDDLRLPAVDAVIHSAALINVDYCQRHPREACNANVLATRRIRERLPQARLIYISADYVFDGRKGGYSEADWTNPLSDYGRTKLLGESEAGENSVIVRTSFYGRRAQPDWPSALDLLLERLRQGQATEAFSDQFSTLILADNLASLIAELVTTDFRGVINLAGPERLSRHQFARKAAQVFGYDPDLVRASSMSDAKLIAPRPRDASLDIGLAQRVLTTPIWDVEQGFRFLQGHWMAEQR